MFHRLLRSLDGCLEDKRGLSVAGTFMQRLSVEMAGNPPEMANYVIFSAK